MFLSTTISWQNGETMSTQDRRFVGQKLNLYIHLTAVLLCWRTYNYCNLRMGIYDLTWVKLKQDF